MNAPEICPTCKQPMPREATTVNPHAERGSVALKCAFCPRLADFIVRRVPVCYEHRAKAAR
jgi:hypothetical protein